MRFSAAEIEKRFLSIPEVEVERNISLAPRTSLRVGGRAALLVLPRSAAALHRVVAILDQEGVESRVLGRGTNLLMARREYGVVISMERLQWIRLDGPTVEVGAGLSLRRLLAWCCRHGLSGLEPLAGIPGSVGGAVFMNAGANGASMADLIQEVEVVDGHGVHRLERREIPFTYRSSGLKGRFITSALLRFRPSDPGRMALEVGRVMAKRRRTQPLGLPSAGCAFKNPQAAPAGRLIEEAGLKGIKMGGAMVSPKHANFIVNCGGATAEEVLGLMRFVQQRVAETSGLELEPEVTVWS